MKRTALPLLPILIAVAAMAHFLSPACKAEDYTIAPADVLEISVWGEQELRQQVVVRPDGKVSFPLVGDIPAAGKTTGEVKDLLEEAIRAYIPDASATVIVRELGSLQYYVIGKVNKPGVFNVAKTITVLQALSLAGGVTPFAKESDILIVRTRPDGTTLQLPFEYDQVKRGRKLEQNIVLERGDTVVVP
jgi:polysaccharide export outer membrane protein